MRYYTETIPIFLAEKLKEKGYWNAGCEITSQYNNACYFKSGRLYKDGVIADWEDLIPAPNYAEVFDWLMSDKNIAIILYRMTQNFRISLRKVSNGILIEDIWNTNANNKDATWHEAANAAIEKALTLI